MKTLAFILFLADISWGLTVNPIELYFTPEGVESTQSIKLSNPTKKPIAVELKAFTREHALNGKEFRKSTNDFLIYPPQTILKPGQTKTARLTWLGRRVAKSEGKKQKQKRSKEITKELPYRLKVSQLPVNVEDKKNDKKTGVKMIYQYIASLYVRERNYKPKLAISKAVRVKEDSVDLTIENQGKLHTILKYYNIKQKHNKKSIYVPLKNLSEEIETTNILAGTKRRVRVTVNKNYPGGRSSFVLERKK